MKKIFCEKDMFIYINQFRKSALLLFGILFLSCLAACGSTANSADSGHAFFNSESSTFHSLTISDKDAITVELDVYLLDTEAAFLAVEVSEDMEGDMYYTYSASGTDSLILGYGPEDKNKERTEFSLPAETESDGNRRKEKVYLKKGFNVFYLSGQDTSCKMQVEITGLDKTKVTYVGMSSSDKEEIMEELSVPFEGK